MGRGDLTVAEFESIRPLLPDQRGKKGRKRHDDHRVLNGILWVLRTGAPWRDLPERFGSWKTVNSRFYRWRAAGTWGAPRSARAAYRSASRIRSTSRYTVVTPGDRGQSLHGGTSRWRAWSMAFAIRSRVSSAATMPLS
jgi:transposase